jgi:hypothetical protein
MAINVVRHAPAGAAPPASRPTATPRAAAGPVARPAPVRPGPRRRGRSSIGGAGFTARDAGIVLVMVLVLLAGTRVLPAAAPAAPAAASAAAPAAVGSAEPASPPAAAPADRNCSAPDPTGGKCLTPTAAHGYAEIKARFASVIRGAGCQDPHAWNPKSDHPKGRACDFFPGKAGQFAKGDDLANGNAIRSWLQANAGPLRVRYVIWQGRIWYADGRGDQPYGGGGVYNAKSATGGHYDHLHVSWN